MALKGIIRYGDPTTGGGRVISAATGESMLAGGKAVCVVGDSATCPIKGHGGVVRIVEGSSSDLWHGKEIAYDGCYLSCGCRVMTTTEDFRIEPNRGGSGGGGASSATKGGSNAGTRSDSSPTNKYDQAFCITDKTTGEIIANLPYKITLSDGRELFGNTDSTGHTQVATSDSPLSATLEAPFHDDDNSSTNANHGHDSCCC
jgi:uncharacterized Zn-binding protein involved in type VI secretion